MTDPSIYAEIVKAVPVVVGGLLAAFAGVATQLLTHYLTISREVRNMKRERLERLWKAVYAYKQWSNDRLYAMLRDEDHETPSPLSEGLMISTLYFPDLLPHMSKLQDADAPMLKFVSDQKLARMMDRETWEKNWNPEPYYKSYEDYNLALSDLLTKCWKLLG